MYTKINSKLLRTTLFEITFALSDLISPIAHLSQVIPGLQPKFY